MTDYTKMTWREMANVIRDLWHEMKRRNPIGINMYGPAMGAAFDALDEIARAERHHRTAEAGPGIDKGKRK